MTKKEKEVVATPESKVAEISREIIKVEKEASSIVVKTQKDYENASKFLSGIVKPRVNRIKELVEFFTNPFKEARKVALSNMNAVEDMFAKQVNALNKIELDVKTAMSSFLREQEEIARKEEARLADIRNKANEKREAEGKEIIAAPLHIVERVDTTIKNDNGAKTTAKKVWKFQIIEGDVMDERVKQAVYQLAYEKGLVEQVIRKMVGSGVRVIQGVKIYEDFDISASAGR